MSADDIDIQFGSHADVRAVADCRWLNSALGARDLQFAEGSERRLTGGCHSIVIHGVLQDRGDAVVKWISGDASLIERTWLRLMLGLDYHRDKRVQLLRSFLVEATFYRNFVSELAGLRVPRARYVEADPWRQRFATVMEAVPVALLDAGEPEGFSAERAGSCLRRMAEFHASHWASSSSGPIPPGADIWERGGYWFGANRGASKRHFRERWSQALSGLGLDPAHAALGQRLAPQLDTIFATVDAIPRRTLIHGDFKVTNIFVDPETGPDGEVWAIDWQWFGRGSPVADSVYFLLTSVRAELLTKATVEAMIRREHHDTLVRNGVTDYSFEDMWSEWRWVAIDFLLYAVSCKWYRMTRADVSTYAAQGHDGFHLRSVEHMESIIALVREFLVDLGLLNHTPDRHQ